MRILKILLEKLIEQEKIFSQEKLEYESICLTNKINTTMLKTVKARINKKGEVKLLEPLKVDKETNAIVTIFDDEIDWNKPIPNETALVSEAALSKYWDRPEEDEAWKDL